MCRSPLETVTYVFILASPEVPGMSCSSYSDGFRDGVKRPYNCSFMRCCFLDLFNITRSILVHFSSSFFSWRFVYIYTYIYIYIYIRAPQFIYIYIYIYELRCPWCNYYRRSKWTRRHEFKSWTRLIAFHIALIPVGKVWIQLFSLQLWVNSRAD